MIIRAKKVNAAYSLIPAFFSLLLFTGQAAAASVTVTSGESEGFLLSVYYDGEEASRLLARMNDWRAGQGLSPLMPDEALNSIAADRACELFIQYSHVRPDQHMVFEDPGAAYGVSAEILGRGKKAEEIFDLWCHGEEMILTNPLLCACGCAIATVGDQSVAVLLLAESGGDPQAACFADGYTEWDIDGMSSSEVLHFTIPRDMEQLKVGESYTFEPVLSLDNGVFLTELSDCIPTLIPLDNEVFSMVRDGDAWVITCLARGREMITGEYQGLRIAEEVSFEVALEEESTTEAYFTGLTESDWEQEIMFVSDTEKEAVKDLQSLEAGPVWQETPTKNTTLTATAIREGVIDLSWSAEEADGYLIYGIRGGEEYKYIGLCEGEENTTYRDEQADPGHANQYWVYPYRIENGRITAGEAIGTIQAFGQAIPAPPEGLQCISTKETVILTWEAGENPPDGWLVYRRGMSETVFTCIGAVQEPVFEDKNAAAGWNQYRAAAFNEDLRKNRITGEAGPAVYGRRLSAND